MSQNLINKVILTKEEIKGLDDMASSEMEKEYMKILHRKKKLMVRLSILSTKLIETFDELEESGMQKSNIKKTAIPFKIQINYFLTKVFKVNSSPSEGGDLIAECLVKVDNLFDEIENEL